MKIFTWLLFLFPLFFFCWEANSTLAAAKWVLGPAFSTGLQEKKTSWIVSFSIQESCMSTGFKLSLANVVIACLLLYPKRVMSSVPTRSGSHWWKLQTLASVSCTQQRLCFVEQLTQFCWQYYWWHMYGRQWFGLQLALQGCHRGSAMVLLSTPTCLHSNSRLSAKQHRTTWWLCLINVVRFSVCQKLEQNRVNSHIEQQWGSCSYLLKGQKKMGENLVLSSKPTIIHCTEHSHITSAIH